MVVRFKKSYPPGAAWAEAGDQTSFEDLQLRIAADGTGDHLKMLMVISHPDRHRAGNVDEVYIALPNPAYSHLFPGYERWSGDLPQTATLLIGSVDEFERHFRYEQR